MATQLPFFRRRDVKYPSAIALHIIYLWNESLLSPINYISIFVLEIVLVSFIFNLLICFPFSP